MALRISAVAVCCSRVSVRARLRTCSSLNRRTFSIAITAWSAKVSSSSTCWSVKGRASVRNAVIAPIATPSRSSGTPTVAAIPCRWMAGDDVRILGLEADPHVLDTERAAARGRRGPTPTPRVSGLASPASRLDLTGPWRATQAHHRPLDPEDLRVLGVAESRGGFHDRVHHRLEIGRRAADDPQNLRGRGLLLERLAQLGGALLDLALEARVGLLELAPPCC